MSHPPVDPELLLALKGLPEVLTTARPEDIDDLRGLITAPSDLELSRGGTLEVSRRQVPVLDGEIDLLLIRPRAAAGRALPAIFYIHGGGMIAGAPGTRLDLVLDAAIAFDAMVCSVDYRLAPEHPHPSPVEDCFAALQYVTRNSDELGTNQLIVLVGSSAGGGLAAGLALMARDRSGPEIAAQVLLAPMLDDRQATKSARELDGFGIWDRTSNRTGWAALLGGAAGGEGVSIYAAPGRADDVEGLPRTYIDVGTVETFRDEVLEFGARLSCAAIDVEMHLWPGAFHGFDGLAPDAVVSRMATEARLRFLKRVLCP